MADDKKPDLSKKIKDLEYEKEIQRQNN